MTRLSQDPLRPDELLAAVGDDGHGGACLFIGTTRRGPGEDDVVALEYEADEALAEREIAKVLSEAEERFSVRVAAAHRLGRVAVGEPSVAVATSGAHRPEAFEACRYLIDEIKARAPIWKRDIHAGGDGRWHDGR